VHECYVEDYDYDEDSLQETEAWLNRIHARRHPEERSRLTSASDEKTAVDEDYGRQTDKRQESEVTMVTRDAEQGQVVEDTGVLRRVVNPVNVYHRFDIRRHSRIGAGLLGSLAKADYALVTVHLPDLGNDTCERYRFLVEQAKWNRLGESAMILSLSA
jgi:hypothetical protein